LEIRWQERGGPSSEEPAATGFGLDFVRKSVAYELGGAVDISFDSAGMTCILSIPLDAQVRSPHPVVEASGWQS
jgi:two-component sensor histidine kinase